jgi:pimeloyl-ACP methyl ester carboxylesterase
MLFCLVHGGQHGAWCFERLIPQLRSRGHAASAVDLPIGDPNAGATEYAEVVAESLSGVTDDVIVVGHSMGGLVIPLVAQLRPVHRLMFLCAAVPEPGRSHFQVKAEEADEAAAAGAAEVWRQPGDRHLAPRENARALFYNDCDEDTQEWALNRLRPQCRKPLTEVTPLVEWPETGINVVNATEDRCIPPKAATANAMRLFGRTPVFTAGGHLPFLAHPEEVAELLVELAESPGMLYSRIIVSD